LPDSWEISVALNHSLLIRPIRDERNNGTTTSSKIGRGWFAVLTYLLGPLLALFPRTLRKLLPAGSAVDWRKATVLSGFAEAVIALIALMYWYSYYMTLLVSNGLDSALAGKMPTGVTDHDIGFTALVIWATHPLTLAIAFGGIEGAVRLVSAAFAETNLGILPLFLLDKIIGKFSGHSERSATKAAGYSEGNISSYVGAIREKAIYKRLPQVPDELFLSGSAPDEFLEIRASRRKADWNPPRTVRYQNTFYRLEASSNGMPPRPFRYTLRKLAAGVMGRTVLVYSPEEEPVLARK